MGLKKYSRKVIMVNITPFCANCTFFVQQYRKSDRFSMLFIGTGIAYE